MHRRRLIPIAARNLSAHDCVCGPNGPRHSPSIAGGSKVARTGVRGSRVGEACATTVSRQHFTCDGWLACPAARARVQRLKPEGHGGAGESAERLLTPLAGSRDISRSAEARSNLEVIVVRTGS